VADFRLLALFELIRGLRLLRAALPWHATDSFNLHLQAAQGVLIKKYPFFFGFLDQSREPLETPVGFPEVSSIISLKKPLIYCNINNYCKVIFSAE
jgi:hypothetical protein